MLTLPDIQVSLFRRVDRPMRAAMALWITIVAAVQPALVAWAVDASPARTGVHAAGAITVLASPVGLASQQNLEPGSGEPPTAMRELLVGAAPGALPDAAVAHRWVGEAAVGWAAALREQDGRPVCGPRAPPTLRG